MVPTDPPRGEEVTRVWTCERGPRTDSSNPGPCQPKAQIAGSAILTPQVRRRQIGDGDERARRGEWTRAVARAKHLDRAEVPPVGRRWRGRGIRAPRDAPSRLTIHYPGARHVRRGSTCARGRSRGSRARPPRAPARRDAHRHSRGGCCEPPSRRLARRHRRARSARARARPPAAERACERQLRKPDGREVRHPGLTPRPTPAQDRG